MSKLAAWILPFCFALCVSMYLTGFVFDVLAVSQDWARPMVLTFWTLPATFGAYFAAKVMVQSLTRMRFERENAHMPVNVNVDGDTGYATVTRLDGEIVSLQVPRDLLDSPEATMEFIVHAL